MRIQKELLVRVRVRVRSEDNPHCDDDRQNSIDNDNEDGEKRYSICSATLQMCTLQPGFYAGGRERHISTTSSHRPLSRRLSTHFDSFCH